MKLDFTNILYFNNIVEEGADLLTIEYLTEGGRGRFTVKMPEFFPTTAGRLKIIIDMVRRAEDPEAVATTIYNYLRKCSDFLTETRNKMPAYADQDKKDRAQFTNQIKKYNANIETLRKYWDFAAAEDPEAVKMQKTDVVTIERNAQTGAESVANYPGYRFQKGGYTFHVYKARKVCYIIIPCCGCSIAYYSGDVRTAPEYITPQLLEVIAKLDLMPLYDHLMELLENAENVILNKDITAPGTASDAVTVQDTTPAPAAADQEDTTTPARAETEKNEPETPPANQAPPRPETVSDSKPQPPYYVGILYYTTASTFSGHPGALYNTPCISDHIATTPAPYNVQEPRNEPRRHIMPYYQIKPYKSHYRTPRDYITALLSLVMIRKTAPAFSAANRAYYNTS